MNYKVLVNRESPLNKTYIPNDLIEVKNEIDTNKLDSSHVIKIEKKVYQEFLKMQKAALKIGYIILIDSGYRSYEYQERILEKNIKEKGNEAYSFVATPGTSEHQTGLCFDVAFIINDKYVDDFEENIDELKWLHNNAHKYGFILRYPKDKKFITGYNYEPWHFRYVGNELASYLYNNELTLEEYYLNKNKTL